MPEDLLSQGLHKSGELGADQLLNVAHPESRPDVTQQILLVPPTPGPPLPLGWQLQE